MTTKTFSNTAGGSWETPGNWTPSGVPGSSDDALINQAGTYTVTLSAVESPNSVTLNDPSATLLISSAGDLLGSPLTMDAGSLNLNGGVILAATVINAGGTFTPASGTLDGVTWQGPLAGPASGFYSINIKDGITLLNLAGTGPGTLDLASLYMVNVLDSTPLSNLTINFDAYNNEYLNGPNSSALILDTSVIVNQFAAGASGQINGGTLDNNGVITATASGGGLNIYDTTFNNAGSLTVGGGDVVTVTAGFANTNTASVSSAGKLVLSTSSNTNLSNTGTISIASAGSLVAHASLAGGGVITIANFGVADMFNTANTETFLDGKGTLRLEAPGSFTGDISGFQKGDKIDLVGAPVTSLSYAGTTSSGVLTVMNNTTTVAALNLLGNYTTASFGHVTDGGTGTNISVSCFAAGTRILTASGEVPVEVLRQGDLLAVRGGQAPVVWIGERHVNCRQHPNPSAVWPVRVAAHAFGEGNPHRTLWLSPDHSVMIDDVLIPIRLLINGTSIAQVKMDAVTYYHVELPEHDVLLAEGMPAESYLDVGQRPSFANGGVVALHPDFATTRWETAACAPIVLTGPKLDEVRARLSTWATRLGEGEPAPAGATAPRSVIA